LICKVMQIPRSTLYSHRHKTKAQTADEDKASVIRRIQARCGFTIGRRRMSAQMKREGISMGESQCHRLMQKFGLQARIRQIRKTRPYTRHPLKDGLPDNILDRNFRADIPMHRLLTDVTYVPYYEDGEYHWGYLSLVLDLYDRSIAAWVFSKHQDIGLAMDTLQILANKGFAEGAILHSDHGSIYTAQPFRDRLAALGVTQSLSRVANCHDNAPMECFNGTIKVEELNNPMFCKDKESFYEINARIERYIAFYNTERPCSVLNNLSPLEFRDQDHSDKAGLCEEACP
jgi:putative transposase